MSSSRGPYRLFWVALFSVAMALVEAVVVVYLRRIYYPEGFSFPLRPTDAATYFVELGREAATLLMLVAVGALAGRCFWERAAYTLVAFGVWDLAYYLWLKLTTRWPASLLDADVLFLIPIPWIAPVIAPCVISVVLIVIGLAVVWRLERGRPFAPTPRAGVLFALGTAILLYSFLRDTGASLHSQLPQAYPFGMLALGCALYLLAFLDALRKPRPIGVNPGP